MEGKEAKRVAPVEAFMRALRAYLHDRGHMLFSMAKASGQRKVKVALRGLWRRHEARETGYEKFMDVVEEIKKCSSCMEVLRDIGIEELTTYEGEPYMIVDVEKLRRLAG